MNVPAIAKRTFDQFKNQNEFIGIVKIALDHLRKLTHPIQRAKFIHEAVDEFNTDIFAHPLIQQYSPCKMGCSACCHTQVSVTDDEAILLVEKIKDGVKIDYDRLKKQMSAKDDDSAYYKLSFEERKCIFLNEEGGCRVYEDRPSVCRTNSVIGESSQCDTSNGVQKTHLVKTPQSDMIIYASFYHSKSSGALPHMVGKALGLR